MKFFRAFLLLAALAPASGCAPFRELSLRATPGVRDPVDCVPYAERCDGPLPVICSPVAVPGSGRHREWPLLPRRADGAQRVCPHGCAVGDAGAGCLASPDGGVS